MVKKASLTLRSGAVIVVEVSTTKTRTITQARISYRNHSIYAAGKNDQDAIKAAHEKFLATF